MRPGPGPRPWAVTRPELAPPGVGRAGQPPLLVVVAPLTAAPEPAERKSSVPTRPPGLELESRTPDPRSAADRSGPLPPPAPAEGSGRTTPGRPPRRDPRPGVFPVRLKTREPGPVRAPR